MKSAAENAVLAEVEKIAGTDMAAMLRAVAAQGIPLDSVYLGSEVGAPEKEANIAIVFACDSAVICRRCKKPHPFFPQQTTSFAASRFRFLKGTGDGAYDFGLRMGSLGKQQGCRILDDGGNSYAFSTARECVESLVSGAAFSHAAIAVPAAAAVSLESMKPRRPNNDGVTTQATGPTAPARLQERIVEILRSHRNQNGLYVSPNIPPGKATNAAKTCTVPPDDTILGLIDCTVFGSASDALVFGKHGFYYHNMAGNAPDPGLVAYHEFPEISFGTAWLNCITLGRQRRKSESPCNVALCRRRWACSSHTQAIGICHKSKREELPNESLDYYCAAVGSVRTRSYRPEVDRLDWKVPR